MGSIPSELSLDCGPTSTKKMESSSERLTPRAIAEILSQLSKTGNVSESQKLSEVEDYVKGLEDEMRKIDAFKRELPLCMLLLTDTIMGLKMELVKYEKANSKPVLEEFIPLKKSCDEDELEKDKIKKDKDSRDNKMNWMSSVQLWNHDQQQSPKVDSKPQQIPKFDTKKTTFGEENRALSNGLFKSCEKREVERAFVPFKGCSSLLGSKINDEELQNVPLLSLDSIGIKRTREDVSCGGVNSKIVSHPVSNSMPTFQSGVRSVSQHQTSASRKQRRCWSPELHRRFVEALHKLGGSQVATPKQIRELMQVDGLTNDEVKSHLQKYRLHTRRVPAIGSTHNDQHHVILGGLWMSKDNKHGESTKQSNSQSDSPQSPLHFCGGNSMTGGDSMEDEEDERSESHSWKSHVIS